MSVFFLTGALLAGVSIVNAQATALDEGYRQMYNLQFPEPIERLREWQRQHPDDPMGPVSDAAAYLFAEFDRLHILQSEFFTHDQHFITDHKLQPDSGVKRQFEAALREGARLVSKNAERPERAVREYSSQRACGRITWR